MKRITLKIQFADKRTEMRQFEDGVYVVGRESGDIPLFNTAVSGRHGEITVSENSVIYTDQGSTNGTLTGQGKRITEPLTMTPGTELRIGECTITLQAIHQPSAATVMQSAVNPNDFANAKTQLNPISSVPQPAPSSPAGSPNPVSNKPQSAAIATASPSQSSPQQNAIAAPSTGFAGSAGSTDTISYDIDLGTVLHKPTADPDWIKKCLIMGLLSCIPLAGGINLGGWLVACYRNYKQGIETLPAANFSYLSQGITLLLAYLPAIGISIGINIVFSIIIGLMPFLFFLSPLVNLVVGLYFFVASPAILYLTIEKNMTWTSIRIKEILSFAKTNSQPYISLLIAFFVAGFIGGLGGIVVIGALLTIPFATAIQAFILSEIK